MSEALRGRVDAVLYGTPEQAEAAAAGLRQSAAAAALLIERVEKALAEEQQRAEETAQVLRIKAALLAEARRRLDRGHPGVTRRLLGGGYARQFHSHHPWRVDARAPGHSPRSCRDAGTGARLCPGDGGLSGARRRHGAPNRRRSGACGEMSDGMQAMHAAIAERVRRLVRCALFAPAPRFARLQRQMARPAVLARWQRWLATRRPASRSARRASGSSGGAP